MVETSFVLANQVVDGRVHFAQLVNRILHFGGVTLVLVQTLAQLLSDLKQVLNCEVVALLGAHVWTAHRGLESEGVGDVKLLKDRDPAGGCLSLLNAEAATVEVERIDILVQDQREDALKHDLALVAVVVAAEDEAVLVLGVAMNV